ncbi:DUF4363 family protein [Salipaludibacillus aurantiacus]|uniref:DUF4363 family protein n=1 Tax=Salipaludibacillus aurantiacus TaxID=1601833 RepID=A0A1H9UQF9_9BACI|nr:DUF4363 family protein [Salipaludibacillus aurantiacus]SES11317.1 protein of unknown function [Salipaludibacillus aurantiacus]
MYKTLMIPALIIFVILISGCSTSDIFITEKDELLFTEIRALYEEIDERKWEDAKSKMTNIEKIFEQRKWKLFMLGQLSQIHDIELEFELLIENINEEDDSESKLGIKKIKRQLYSIYNL